MPQSTQQNSSNDENITKIEQKNIPLKLSAKSHKKIPYKLIGYSKWQRTFRERDQFREEYDIPDGDIRNGSEIFYKSCCVNCHSVEDEYNMALPLEVIYRFKGMIMRPRYTQCSYEWNRNRLYAILWEPNSFFKTDYLLDTIEDSQERADIAEYIMHLKYSSYKPQTWHDG